MATIHPISALRFLRPSESKGRAYSTTLPVDELIRAADPEAALRRGLASGELVEDGPPGLFLLEVRPEPLPSIRPPVRFVVGGLRRSADSLELEQVTFRPRRPAPSPIVTLVEDDQHVLRAMLAEFSQERPADVEAIANERLVKLWRLPSNGFRKRLVSYLEDAQARPVTPLPEQSMGLAAWVSMSEPGLRLQPVHRAIREMPTFNPERFLTLVSSYARIIDLDQPLSTRTGIEAARRTLASMATGTHAVLLVLPDRSGRILRFRQRLDLAQIKAAPKDPTLRSLDLALLDSMVLHTVLGISDPEFPGHKQVFTVEGLHSLVAQVQGGTFQAGFALNPPPLWEIRAVMEARRQLPPHTLLVDPTPPTGLLFLKPPGAVG